MNTLAKVLTVANLVMAVAFIFMTAPVAQKRIELIQKMETEQAKLAPVRKQIEDLESQRRDLQATITRKQAALQHAIVTGLNSQGEIERQIATLADEAKGLAAKQEKWTAAIAETKEEITAREEEFAAFEEKIEDAETQQMQINAQVNQLRGQVEKTKSAEADLHKQITENYAALLELEEKVAAKQPSVSLTDRQ